MNLICKSVVAIEFFLSLTFSSPSPNLQELLRLRGIPISETGIGYFGLFADPALRSNPLAKTTASLGDPNWETPFFAQGPAGPVFSLASLNGKIIAAGEFYGADDVHSPSIAEWNGLRWSSLGGGQDPSYTGKGLMDMVVDGNRIYVATAPKIAGVACRGPAYWDSTGWTCMTWDLESEITQIGVWNGKALLSTGGGVYQWDGLKWQPFSAIQGSVMRFRSGVDGMWMSGRFSIAGDSSIRNLAMWSGAAWKGFGNASESLRDFAVLGSQVFAIENHKRTGQADSQAVVRWNGSDWSRADLGTAWASAMCLASDSQNVYLAAADSYDAHGYLWKWSGSRFLRLEASGYAGTPFTLMGDRGRLYLGGLVRAGEAGADNAMEWVGGKWKSLTTVVNSGPFYLPTLLRSNGVDLFVGGRTIMHAGNKPASGIARWNGTLWDPMGGGFKVAGNGIGRMTVGDIVFHGSDVYAGGRFDSAQGGAAKNIARWDGSAWHALGGGFPGEVHALLYDRDGLVAGGAVDSSDTASSALKNQIIGRWDGSDWWPMGSGLQGRVDKLAYYRGKVCAFGNLKGLDDTAFTSISIWDGLKWAAVQDRVGAMSKVDSVIDVAIFRDTVFILGYSRKSFEFHLSRWDGSAVPVRETLRYGTALATDGASLYLAGDLRSDLYPIGSSLFKYDAGGWRSLLSDQEFGYIPALAVAGNYLYAGGKPQEINGKPVYALVRWNRTAGSGILVFGEPHAKSRLARLQFLASGRLPRDLLLRTEAVEFFALNGRREAASSFRSNLRRQSQPGGKPAAAIRVLRLTAPSP